MNHCALMGRMNNRTRFDCQFAQPFRRRHESFSHDWSIVFFFFFLPFSVFVNLATDTSASLPLWLLKPFTSTLASFTERFFEPCFYVE